MNELGIDESSVNVCLRISWKFLEVHRCRRARDRRARRHCRLRVRIHISRCPGMRGYICKNEQEEILVVGRKTSDRVGIRAEVLDLHTQMHVFAQ